MTIAAIDLADVAAGTGGFVIYGQNVGDYSGHSVASAGDINGDGFDDLIIGAIDGDAAGNTKSFAGESYVVFGSAGGFGAAIDLVNVAAGTGGFVIYGQEAYDKSGWSVASAGDINRDGYDDLMIGARYGAAAGNLKRYAGETYVLFGKAGGFGAAIDLVSVAAGTGGFVIYGQDADDGSSRSVASAGDINGDGFDDLIIGANYGDAAGNAKYQAGDTYVVFGKAGGFGASIDLVSVAAGTGGFVIHGQDVGDYSGRTVASAGDVNGDGFDDLLISAEFGRAAGNTKYQAGDSYVVFGKSSGFGASLDLATIAAGSGGFVIHGQDVGDRSGGSLASAGDINGDGYDDLIIGASNADAAGNAKNGAGDSYVVFGKAGGFGASIDLVDVAAGNGGFVIHGQDVLDYSGSSVASAGDINGDGFDDLIIGAFGGDASGNAKSYAGECYVILGKAGGFGAGIDLADIAAGNGGFVIYGRDANDRTGRAVASAGDINGDGFDDLIIGVKYGDAAGNAKAGAGESYVVYGSDFTGLGTLAKSITGSSGADILVAGLGNDTVNGAAGDDALRGGAGDDVLAGGAGADRIDGGNGNDTVDYSASAVAVRVNLVTDVNTGGHAAGDHLDDIENLVGSAFNDTLTGDVRVNSLSGLAGADSLIGDAGADTLDGGSGADTMAGGDGNDTYFVDDAGDVVTESKNSSNGTTDTVISSVTRTLGGYQENLVLSGTDNIDASGNKLLNQLTGNSGNNVLNGGAGADTMSGGLGDDTYYVSNVGDHVIESSDSINGGVDTVRASVSRTLGDYQENLVLFGINNINGNGNGLDNAINGNDGNNVLNGLAGADTMAGGHGNDTYYVDNSADVVSESADSVNGGIDSVLASVTRTLGGFQENLVLTGGSAAINGTGNSLDNTLTGNNGANVLNGGTGNDTVSGGLGSDRLIGDDGADQLTGGGGNDTFDFNALSEMGTSAPTRDVITDFSSGFDKIDLGTLDANTATGANDAFSGVLVASFTAAGQLMLVGDVLYGNTDADTDAEFSIQLLGIATLNAADFVL